MSMNDPQRSLRELERLRDELRECIERAQEALTRRDVRRRGRFPKDRRSTPRQRGESQSGERRISPRAS